MKAGDSGKPDDKQAYRLLNDLTYDYNKSPDDFSI